MYITKKQLLDCIRLSIMEHGFLINVDEEISDTGKVIRLIKTKVIDVEKFYNLIDKLQDYQDFPVSPFPTSPTWHTNRQCMKCGITLEGVMSYSCPRADCITGLGSPFCLSGGQSETSNPVHIDNPQLTKVYHNGVWYQKENDGKYLS